MTGTVWVEHVECTSAGTGFLDEGWQQQHHWWRRSMTLKAWASPNAPKSLNCSGWPGRSSPLKGQWWALLQHHHPWQPWAEPPHWPWDLSLAMGCVPCQVLGITGEGTAPWDEELPQGYSALLLTVYALSCFENDFLKNKMANLVKKWKGRAK